jgi:acetoin utilization protein AcuC
MKTSEAVFLHSPRLDEIGYPPDCPFNSHRAGMTRRTVYTMGLLDGKSGREVEPAPATRTELEEFHTPKYLDALQEAESGNLTPAAFAMGIGTPDCPVFSGMNEYASLACGASLTGARMLLSREARVAFNPSGGYHHAGPEKAAGFCYLNDVALAAGLLAGESRRILILDMDVHHGDGTQNAFYDRDDIMTISIHQDGQTLFPGTGFIDEIGKGPGTGYNVNIPLPEGTHDDAYEQIFNTIAFPLINRFDPDIFLLELGMDGLANDPLAQLNLTNNVFADILQRLRERNKPMLVTGGGGYHVKNTVRAWALIWSTLTGVESCDLGIGMGGVMLENTEWAGGLRDRILPPISGLKEFIDSEIRRITDKIKSTVFPLHGLN